MDQICVLINVLYFIFVYIWYFPDFQQVLSRGMLRGPSMHGGSMAAYDYHRNMVTCLRGNLKEREFGHCSGSVQPPLTTHSDACTAGPFVPAHPHGPPLVPSCTDQRPWIDPASIPVRSAKEDAKVVAEIYSMAQPPQIPRARQNEPHYAMVRRRAIRRQRHIRAVLAAQSRPMVQAEPTQVIQ